MTDFHERQGLTWCKLHYRWWTCESHADIHVGLLGVGALLMSIANRFGRQPNGSGLVIGKTGKVLTLAQLAHRGRCTEEYVSEALAALSDAETIEITDDGAIRFPSLQRWQEDPSTERKRKAVRPGREIHADIPSEAHKESADSEREIHASEDQRIRGSEEDQIRSDPPNPPRGESSFSLLPVAPAPTSPARRRKGPPKVKADRAVWFLAEAERAGRLADVDAVCSAFVSEHQRIRPRARPKPGTLERGLIAEHLLSDAPGYTVAELVEAIRGCHADHWHLTAGKLDLEYIVRDSAHVESLRRKWEAAQDSPSGTTGGQAVRMDPVRLGPGEQIALRNQRLRDEAEQQRRASWGDEGADIIDVGRRRGLSDGRGSAA